MRHCTPTWVQTYMNKRTQLRGLQSSLEQDDPTTNPCFQKLELHPMEFKTGEILYKPGKFDFMFEHFAPDPHISIPESLDDSFSNSRQSKTTVIKNEQMSIANTKRLFQSFDKHSRVSRPRPKEGSYWSPTSMWGHSGYLFLSNDRHGFTIESAATRTEHTGGRNESGHRLVVMRSNTLQHENKPSVGELAVLVRWMVAAFKDQKSPRKKPIASLYCNGFNHDFPTMIISFLPECHVRVLFGYFEQGLLKVAYTEAIDFDTDDSSTNMRTLLQWAWPKVHSDTSKPIPLPPILEENEAKSEQEFQEPQVQEEKETEEKGDKEKKEDDQCERGINIIKLDGEFESHLETSEEEKMQKRKRKRRAERSCRRWLEAVEALELTGVDSEILGAT